MIEHPVALVTGSTRGIGAGIARALARAGFAVATNGRGEPGGIVDEIRAFGVPVLHAAGTVSDGEDRRRIVDEVLQAFGRIDLLVNNAGVAPQVRADLLEATEESFDRVMGINLKGPYFLTQLVARHMVDLLEGHPGLEPRIINISSISAYTASPSRGEYCLSKAGLSMMTKLFAERLAPEGIGVYEVRPGLIETDMTSAVKDHYDGLIEGGLTPIRRWGRPDDVAAAVVAIAKGALGFSTGEVLNVDGGFHLRRL